MRYGFVIDQDRCIGCHACTVACKEEHQVPVGVFRTWVKYIEKGEFPHTRRHFGVMRCNHCDSAPCITICPTHALYRRSDGIIDFDNRRCIGCKSCMQACPYDALYIDPSTNTAAKCNFCAHRVEANLEPACVIVCPTQAIIAGDLDNPASKISRLVATEKVSVRKPQKGTQPKLYYKGIEGDLLDPARLSRQDTYAFAEQRDGRASRQDFDPALTREVYDVAHPAPWGWKIAAYLWTKSVAAGVLLVTGLLTGSTASDASLFSFDVLSPILALAALALTLMLLVGDLKRPGRFFYLLIMPNFRSWLVLGAYILMAYGICAIIWLILGLSLRSVQGPLKWMTAIFALAAAGYSAFLFAQAKGRELWQSSLFFFHLLVQAMVAGSAIVLIVSIFNDSRFMARGSYSQLMGWMVVNLAMVLGEVLLPHGNEDARLAVRSLIAGRWSVRFWMALGVGMVLPFFFLQFNPIVAAVLALAGIWWWEDLWVKAGQAVPLS